MTTSANELSRREETGLVESANGVDATGLVESANGVDETSLVEFANESMQQVSSSPPAESMQQVSSRSVLTRVGMLHVEDRGRGPAVLCWPSLFADARTLDVVAEALAEDHRVIVVDGPGHGESGCVDHTFTLADCADAAMEVLDALRIDRVAWVGAAWGGHVGVAAALRHPNRLDGLAILNTPMAPWRGRRLALMRLSQALLAVFGPRSFVARLIVDKSIAPSAGPDRGALVDVCEAALRRCDPSGLSVAMRSAMFEREDLLPELANVRVPTVFFAGVEDGLFPLEEARAQAEAIPGCRFVAVERSAHHSAMERPDVVLPILREALRRRASGASRPRSPATSATPH